MAAIRASHAWHQPVRSTCAAAHWMKSPAHVRPAELQGHHAAEQPRQLLVGAVAVADDHCAGPEFPEQPLHRLGAAARVDVEVDRVVADRGPQPGARRTALRAQRLYPPGRLVGVAQRECVLVRADRLGERLEQGHEARRAVGQRAGRDRQPLVTQPRGDPLQRAQARVVLEQQARPYARAVRRAGKQPRHRRCREFRWRRCAAAPAPPRPSGPRRRPGRERSVVGGRGVSAAAGAAVAAWTGAPREHAGGVRVSVEAGAGVAVGLLFAREGDRDV